MHIGYLGATIAGIAAAGTAFGMAVSSGSDGFPPENGSATRLPIERAVRTTREAPGVASAPIRGAADTSTDPERSAAIARGPRDPAEWQGMPVHRLSIPCSDEAACQAALACIDGHCDACSSSDECQTGEVCVVEHCLLAKLAKCTSYRDCPSGEVCVLSGYSDDLRGNGAMEAMCSGSLRERIPVRPEYPPEAYLPNPSPVTRLTDALLGARN
jgi:hypothetical protein